jgi:hypothetical protein
MALARSGEAPERPHEPISLHDKTRSEPPVEAAAKEPAAPTAAPADAPSPTSKRFSTLPDGSPVPALPEDAPQRVKLGVAIFRYAGAEGPPRSDRKKDEAARMARVAAVRGQTDFAGAVQLGDRGSDENIGWIARGILEPAVEHAVFGLDVGKTSAEPIDTPRGFWVVRRVR